MNRTHLCLALVMLSWCRRSAATKQVVQCLQVLPFFQAYHGSMGRVAAFSSSITKIQRLKDCIQLFGQPYCDIANHNGGFDIAKSLPEFEKLPHPTDATILKFDSSGEYDNEASMAAKEQQAQAA